MAHNFDPSLSSKQGQGLTLLRPIFDLKVQGKGPVDLILKDQDLGLSEGHRGQEEGKGLFPLLEGLEEREKHFFLLL